MWITHSTTNTLKGRHTDCTPVTQIEPMQMPHTITINSSPALIIINSVYFATFTKQTPTQNHLN